jgi:hypothetical protein
LFQNLPIPFLDVVEILGLASAPDFASFSLDATPLSVDTVSSFYTASTRRLFLKTTNWVDLTAVRVDQPSIITWNAMS